MSAGITGDGEPIVVWSAPKTRAVWKVTAAVGGATTELGDVPWRSQPALAVAPDGHALATYADDRGLHVSERAPGGAFGAPVRVAAIRDPLGGRTRAQLAPDGRAVIATAGIALGGVRAVTREPGAAFSAPVTLAAADRTMSNDVFLNGQSSLAPPGRWGFGGADITATLTADGRALVSWVGTTRAAILATLAGGAPALQTFGGDLADASFARAVLLADGTPALVWGEAQTNSAFRLRLAADGATGSSATPPDVRIGTPKSLSLARPRCHALRPGAVQRPV